MKEIMLTRGQVALVDDGDYAWLSRWKWCARKGRSGKFYAARSQRHKTVLMHRVIIGAKEEEEVDHKKGNTLDNRRRNLRLCTPTQNKRNSRLRKDSTSGYKGVTFNKSTQKWHAQINMFLGSYSTPEAAARAYDTKAVELFGEFARPNFPRRIARK